MRDPAFWWRERSTPAKLLAPAAALYGMVASARMARPGRRALVPVICVGNFTVGGAGKTPTALALAPLLAAAGERVFFLSRGYGGRLAGPVRVGDHGASEVGDEPLLLAQSAPTIVARDRIAGAAAAAAAGASVIVMDDGLQNASVAKDFALAVVDGRRGIGNELVFPAGPLRAPLAAQLDHVDAVLVVETARAADKGSSCASVIDGARERNIPIFHGELAPDAATLAALAGQPVLAFAGIGDPEKFFTTLARHGIPVAIRAAYADHHRYTAAEIRALLADAEWQRLVPVTTEKDFARLRGDATLSKLAERAQVLPVKMKFHPPETLGAAVLQAIRSSRAAAAFQPLSW